MHQHPAVVRLLNEIRQHFFRDFEVGNHAVFHGLDSDDVAGSAAQHLFRFLAHSFYFTRVLVDGDDGGFVDDDALAARIHQGIGGAEIDSQIAGENAEQRPEVVRARAVGITVV